VFVRNLKKAVTVTISGNTIVENRPEDETAAWDGYGIYLLYQGTAKIANNIIAWNGAGGIGHQLGMVLEARNNCVYGNNHSNFSSATAPNPLNGNGNIVVNPMLASMPYDDYHIRHDSPCRNAGDPGSVLNTPDMDGQARVQGGTVDIGYDESDGTVFHPGYNVVRVSASGNDANDGSTWPKAKGSLQAAVTLAGMGGEVWAAKGTYTGTVVAPQSLLVYGGFAGTETERPQRNLAANTVILDGGGIGTVYSVKGGSTAVVEFDGFTVRNSAPSSSGFYYAGGGLATLAIRNNVFRANGTGVTVFFGGAAIRDNIITDNSADGIYLNGADRAYQVPSVTGNLIHGNRGNGVSGYSGPLYLANNQITRNGTSTTNAGVTVDPGSGMLLRLINNTIAANAGFGVYARSGDTLEMVNNIVAWNRYDGVWKWNNLPTDLRNNCVYGNVYENYANFETDPTGTSGNISVNPGFATVPYNDFHIRHDSPCRDAGNSAFAFGTADLDGQARVQGPRVDIGADESNGAQYDPLRTIVRVKPAGSDAQDGSDWAKAKKTVQAAMDMALGGEVWVAAGTYQHTGALYSHFLTHRPNVPVYGGFAENETARDQRNTAANPTILHGGATGDVVRIEGGVTSPTVLDGFTITGSADFGSAVDVEMNAIAQIFVRNNILEGNHDGVTALGASPVIALNRIRNNTGVGIAIQNGAEPAVLNNRIERNAGNGISITESSGRIANNLVADNADDFYEAGLSVSLDTGDAPSFENNTIVRNGGYGVNSTGQGTPLYVNNIIAWNGQGFRTDDQSPTLRNNNLYGNAEFNTRGFAADPIGANGNISKDPALASAARADYHIRSHSPSVNAGDASVVLPGDVDMDGQPRIQNGGVDIGSDESDGTVYPPNANAVHVSTDGSDANDGSSWAMAKKTIGAALAGGPGIEVWVEGGTYVNPTTEEYEPFVTVRSHQNLYGGFAGMETERGQRRPWDNLTVIDGNGYGSAVVLFDGNATVDTVLDGFVVRNPSSWASGIRIASGNHVVVRDTLVRDCNTGINIDNGSPRIVNNTIGLNQRGINAANGAPQIRNNLLVYNAGEALYMDGEGSAVVVNNTIARNTPSDFSGAVYVGSSATPTLVNNIVAFNTSGVYAFQAQPVLRHNNVYGNGTDYQYIADPTGSNGNIAADPRFVNADEGDFHLLAGSPSIDKGDNAALDASDRDYDMEARKAGAAVDIGVDEYGSSAPLGIEDIRQALKAAAGLQVLTATERDRLNAVDSGASQGRVDLLDVIKLLRAMLAG